LKGFFVVTTNYPSYDVIIVGAGHNGLVCAAYLARAGARVLVLERRSIVGGACVTEELMPGFRFSTASLVASLFRDEIVQDLQLEAHGLQFLPRDPSVVALLPDGDHLMLGGDQGECMREIARFSRADADSYGRYGDMMQRLGSFMRPHFVDDAGRELAGDAPALKTALSRALDLSNGDFHHLVRLLFGSAREFLDGWFETDALKAALAIDGITGVNAGPSAPGTAYLMLYHMTGMTETGRPAWSQIKGGMGGLTLALAAAARSCGAEIVTGADAARILVDGSAARGVELADGRSFSARAVASAADPRTTFLELLEREHVPTGLRHAIRFKDFGGVAAKIHLALDRLPTIAGFEDSDRPGRQYQGTLLVAPSLDYLDEAYADARNGHPSENPHIECTIPTILDPSLAPAGKHVMSMYVQYAPYSLTSGTWAQVKEQFADRVLNCMEGYMPGLTSAVIGRRVYSPADLEAELSLAGGNLYHGAMSPADLILGRPGFGCAGYRTPVDGLYLCASGAAPGGGVSGVPGASAARVIASDLDCPGLSPSDRPTSSGTPAGLGMIPRSRADGRVESLAG
jgi:phytoene dehydrogenase-like protein